MFLEKRRRHEEQVHVAHTMICDLCGSVQYDFLTGINRTSIGESLKEFGKPIEKFKIENLVTQLTPLVLFLAIAKKFQSIRGIIP